MSNNLAVKQNTLPAAPAMQQTGTNNFNVTNQEGGTVNFNITYQHGVPGNSAEMMMAIQSFSKEYYQLIVTCEDDVFANNMVTIPTSRALTKYTVPSEIFERCSTLSETAIEELKRFPAIICRENTELKGVTDPNQWAMFAYIKAVRISGKNVKIVKRNAVFFDLNMDCAVTDLNHSAWSVHKVNVFEAFDEAQIPGIPRPM